MPAPQEAFSPSSFTRFGELLRFLRHRARLTQRELSIAVGYNFAHLSRLEQGARLPDPAVVAAVFVPALDLEHEPAWAARLIALAEDARHQAAAHTAASAAPVEGPADALPRPSTAVPPAMPDATPLLATKLFVPRARPDAVPRPRLLHQLDRALSVPLTLVAAPAGFGKTTLLAAWLSTRTEDRGVRTEPAVSSLSPHSSVLSTGVAWLSLDSGDNDLATFVRYLVAACQRLAPAVGQMTLALLQQPAQLPASTLLAPLLNDLAELPDSRVLILDDVHMLTAPMVHSALGYVLEHLPPQLHLALASREDPPLPLYRLRARAQLLELRASELRFSVDESGLFLRDSMGVALTDAAVTSLTARTEGWAAGLQLAALALQNRPDPSDVVGAFKGNNRYLGDYLAGEVLDRLPAHLKTFVLQTSILERMCGELCDAVLGLTTDQRPPTTDQASDQAAVVGGRWSVVGDSYSQLLLAELERRQLFLVPLDEERRWYRYHHLFGEILRARLLNGASAAVVAALHRRASAWYEGQQLVVEAVQHALAAQDSESAARLIEDHGALLMGRGQVYTVHSWLNTLPDAVMQRRPHLCIVHAAGLVMTKQLDAAEARLDDAERGLPLDTPGDLAHLVRGRVALVRGIIRFLTGNLPEMIGLMQRALALVPEPTTSVAAGTLVAMVRAVATMFAEMAYKLTGDVTKASERRATDAIGPVRATGNLTETLYGYTSLAYLQLLQGRLRAAAATYAEVERLVSGPDALKAVVGSPAYYFGMAGLLREWNELDSADQYLTSGVALVHGGLVSDADTMLLGYWALAQVQQARGQGEAALATLDAFIQLARERHFSTMLIEQAAALRARLQFRQGDLSTALRWAEGSGLSVDEAISFPREAAVLTLARVRIAGGQAVAVLPLLERLLADAEVKARRHSAIETLAVQALAYDALGDRQRALTTLEQTLALAEPEGYVRIFLDEGAPMAALLRELRAQGTLQAYAQQLLAAFDQRLEARDLRLDEGTQASSLKPQASLLEPLSARELDVLQLLAQGHSNRAIAAALTIEVGTVKRHLHSLLGKLAAESRTEAVARARSLGLL